MTATVGSLGRFRSGRGTDLRIKHSLRPPVVQASPTHCPYYEKFSFRPPFNPLCDRGICPLWLTTCLLQFTVEHVRSDAHECIRYLAPGARGPEGGSKHNARVARLSLGNFGDHKPISDGLSELRIDTGPGYRVYYTRRGRTLIMLLIGGAKGTQKRDIKRALEMMEKLEG
jgi:putative addiction module killer protein